MTMIKSQSRLYRIISGQEVTYQYSPVRPVIAPLMMLHTTTDIMNGKILIPLLVAEAPSTAWYCRGKSEKGDIHKRARDEGGEQRKTGLTVGDL